MGLGLVRRRNVWLPTWKGWLLLLTITLLGVFGMVKALYPFLAINAPLPKADLLVVDGWVSDRIIRVAAGHIENGSAHWICSTGVEVNPGELFTEHTSWAELGGDSLRLLGVPEERLLLGKAEGGQRHRTYQSALAVRRAVETRGISLKSINILTEGSHARRSRMVYRKVFGDDVVLGVIAETPEGYDSNAWWNSSNGFKIVLMEAIALAYEWAADGGR